MIGSEVFFEWTTSIYIADHNYVYEWHIQLALLSIGTSIRTCS